MKKLLLGVIAFALIITSCNKYEDDFKDLNAKIDALKAQVAGVAALQTGLIAAQAQLTALSAAVAALPNPTASIATLGTNLAALSTKVTTVQTALDKLAVDVAAGKVTSDAAAVKVAQLQTALIAAQADITDILANTSMYVGNVSITSDAEVTFWTPKIAQLAMINGNLTVTTAGISVSKIAAMNVILPNITAVIGNVTITAAASKAIDLSELTTVVGDFYATGGNLIPQSTMDISSLASVTGNLTLSFDGPYASTALTTVGGNLALTNYTTTGTTITGTTSVNFPLVAVTGAFSPASLPLATTVNVAGNMTTFDAAKATTVTLRGNYTAGLVFNAPLATSVSIGAATAAGAITINAAVATSVSLPNLTTAGAGNAIGITTSAVTAVALPLLATSGDITINMGANNGSVDLSLFASNVAVTVTGPQTLSLPSYVAGTGLLTSTTAKTVTLAKHSGAPAPALAAVETLTMGALNTAAFNISAYTTLKVASITGKSGTTSGATGTAAVAGVTSSTNATVTSLTLAGPMVTAVVDDQTKLTTLATSGIINSLTVNSCDLLTGVSFAHTHFVGGTLGTGSVLVVTNNPKLAALTTSTNYMKTLTVTGNVLLTTMNFSSYVDILYPGSSVGITISGNKTSGVYTAPVVQTPTTPWVEAVVKSNDFLTLKAYVAKMTVIAAALTQTLSLSFDDDSSVTGTQTLASLMLVGTLYNAVTCPTIIDATGGINTPAEMALVVAN
ncbi:MAG: hypothetical protein WC854_09355 [Bacteroidales bacterium]